MEKVSFDTVLDEIKKDPKFMINEEVFENNEHFEIVSNIFRFVYEQNGWNFNTLEKHINQFRNHMNDILKIEGENEDE